MATWIQRTIAAVEAYKAGTTSNAFVRQIARAFAHSYRGQWESLIGDAMLNTVTSNTPPESTVINPANLSDVNDIGVLNSDTEVFTPATVAQKDKLLSLNYIRLVRDFHRQILTKYRLETRVITAGEAGQTAADYRALTLSDAAAEAVTELGDPANDPET